MTLATLPVHADASAPLIVVVGTLVLLICVVALLLAELRRERREFEESRSRVERVIRDLRLRPVLPIDDELPRRPS